MKKIAPFLVFSIINLILHAQNVGIGEATPANKLSVKGSLSVGSAYSTTAAPANGVIVQGNVGIGTTSPTAILDVTSSSASEAKLNIINTSTGNSGIEIRGTGASSAQYIDFANGSTVNTGTGTPDYINRILSNSTSLTLSTNNFANGIVLLNGGNVGIGVASPAYSLDVLSSLRVSPSGSSNVTVSGGATITSGGYTYVVFTSSGTFTPTGPLTVDVLVVGGGGGGGGNGGGGGGAGAVVENASYSVSGPVAVTVGAGGAGCTAITVTGSSGGSSSFGTVSPVTAAGGGGAASRDNGGAALSGASGGGGGGCAASPQCTGGSATNGNAGASGNNNGCSSAGGGGGGAGGTATAGGNSTGGAGGAGLQKSGFAAAGGSPAGYFGGGGGGGVTCYNPSTGGLGGTGGGGTGNGNASGLGYPGIPNTGGGGGGGGAAVVGGAGGSGIVIVKYLTATSGSTSSQPTIMATSSGYVGVGTSSPAYTLQVNGTFQATSLVTGTYSSSTTGLGHIQAYASCQNGTLISGGCWDSGDFEDGGAGNTALVFNYPVNAFTWRCGSRDLINSQSHTLTAYVICTK